MILFLTDDLSLPFRVMAAAKSAGTSVRIVKPEELSQVAGALPVTLAICDLSACGPSTSQVLTVIRSRWPLARTIAFGPHVDEALLASASAAGCGLVLPRSKFAQQLTELVREAADGGMSESQAGDLGTQS